MKKRGVSRCAALLVVLLMMMSTAVMLPSQDATAQTHKVWGFVKNVNCILPVEGAVVSLTDVHGLDPTYTTVGNGYYEFLTGPGFYEVEVSKDGFFSQTKGPFRFNADTNMRVSDFCLEPTPDLDYQITGTVLSSVTSQVTLEHVEFDTETMPEEPTKGTLSGNTVELQNSPIVHGSYTGWWDHPLNGTDNILVEGVGNDYTIDLWTGIVTIENPWILTELPKNNVYLNFTYDHADNATALDHGYISTYEAFKNSISWIQPGNYDLDVDTGDLEIISGNFTFGLDTLEFTYENHPTIIDGATVKIFNVTKAHTVDEDSSLSTGLFALSTWAGLFELQAWAEGYQPYLNNIQVTGDISMWILMEPGININGWVTDSSGTTAVDNVRAFMLCLDPVPESIKLLEAEVSGASYYKISAYPGTFRLYVDADGYQGQYKNIDVITDAVYDFALELSEEELVETSIGYVGDDWNKIAVYKNLTLNNDSHIPSLGTSNFGNLALEVDWAIGDKDGMLTVMEWDAFETWLEDRGPQFLKTSGFFTTEDEEYTLDLTGYDVTLSDDNVNVWIDTVATYSTSDIESDLDSYDLTLNAVYDSSILIDEEDKILTNYTYWVHSPKGYELTWNSSVNTDVIGFTEILVDPKKGTGSGTVVLRLGKSDVGVAYAKIVSPQECPVVEYKELCVSIINDDPEDYLAVIPAEMDINFSAEDSTDPNSVGDGTITPYANFTWDFGDGSSLGYGIIATHNYSDPGGGPGNYTVTLTIVEPGGNVTSREINVSVDARAPNALVWFDEDDKKLVNSKFHINEDIEFNLGANLSTDETWTDAEGEIRFWEWDLDSDGNVDHFTEMVDTVFYTEPGEYYLNLTVWDWVGHKSTNYSKKISVDDTTPPTATFRRYDSNFVETDYPFEQAPVYFNASETTDNFSTLENLTFDWEIDETTPSGMNVSYTFSEPGDYEISLKATDEAGNPGWYNITLVVAPNRTLHSHISIPRDTLEFDPEKPEMGQSVKIRVNVTNSEEGIDATNLTVHFWIRGETEDKEIKGTVKFYENGTLVSGSILPVNTTYTAEISWKPGSQGDYTILVNCTVDNEFPNSEGDNEIQGTLTVKEAGYITLLIISVLVILIFIIAIILLLRRKFGGRFPKLRREKKPEKEKKKKKRVKK